jgi:hypothetical protein
MNIIGSKDVRQYIASGVFVALIVALMLFLTFIEIPTSNKDLIVSIISMFVGGLGVAMGKLFGDNDAEIDQLKEEMSELRVQYDTVKGQYDSIVRMLVERHVVNAEGIEILKRSVYES